MAKAKKNLEVGEEVTTETVELPTVKEDAVVVIEDTTLKSLHGEDVLSVDLGEGNKFIVRTKSGQTYTLPISEYEHYLKHDPKRK